jgi:hypothetical protein
MQGRGTTTAPQSWPRWQASCVVNVMNDISPSHIGPDMSAITETASANLQALAAANEASLEQQMTELGLSNDTRRFLRHVHLAEKQLNDAFNKSHQGGELEQRVSQLYHDLYGTDCAVRDSRREKRERM